MRWQNINSTLRNQVLLACVLIFKVHLITKKQNVPPTMILITIISTLRAPFFFFPKKCTTKDEVKILQTVSTLTRIVATTSCFHAKWCSSSKSFFLLFYGKHCSDWGQLLRDNSRKKIKDFIYFSGAQRELLWCRWQRNGGTQTHCHTLCAVFHTFIIASFWTTHIWVVLETFCVFVWHQIIFQQTLRKKSSAVFLCNVFSDVTRLPAAASLSCFRYLLFHPYIIWKCVLLCIHVLFYVVHIRCV